MVTDHTIYFYGYDNEISKKVRISRFNHVFYSFLEQVGNTHFASVM